MNENSAVIATQSVEDIYSEVGQWHVNVGEEKIHPKRMSGRWRNVKWWTSSVWLLFFLGPYLRWEDRQAVLFDLPSQKFYLFGLTVLPQDLWILSLILLFFAILLAVVTALAGRVFCGFFCFQTVWTDVYVLIEEWLEGNSRQRQKLDQSKWSLNKLRIKAIKHSLWLLIGLATGLSFVAWFMDAYQLWSGLWQLSLPLEAIITISAFVVGTYSLAGFMREQTCLWLCPYSRIQGVMVDHLTVLPAYDVARGEPRGRRRKEEGKTTLGDCIDCNLCVAVCPTGVDIRQGQQQGCITCALCIDACDSVMDKIGRPRGLIRYDSLNGLEGAKQSPWFKRGRVWTYLAILSFAVIGGAYGLATLDALELKVIQQRQPLFVTQSDGSIQNRYRLKILNKVDRPMVVKIGATADVDLRLIGAEREISVKASGVTSHDVFVRIDKDSLSSSTMPIFFDIRSIGDQSWRASRQAVFIGPAELDNGGAP